MKTMNLIKVLSFFFFFAMISCTKDNLRISGEGPIITKDLDVPNFSGLDLAISCNVVISQGPTQGQCNGACEYY